MTEVRTLDGADVLARRTLAYDQLHRLIKQVADALKYDPGTQAITNVGSHVRIAEYEAGKMTHLVRTEETGNRSTFYAYEPDIGRLQTLMDSIGNKRTYSYRDGTHYLKKIERFLKDGSPSGPLDQNYVTEFVVDNLGRVIRIEEKGHDGNETALVHQFGYNTFGLVDTYTDPMGKVQEYLVDALGRLVERAPVGSSGAIINTTEFTDFGLPDSQTKILRKDDLLHETITYFDFVGRPYILQNPGADPASPPSDAAGQRHKPFSWLAIYDEASRLTDVYDGDNGHTKFHHDGPGRLIVREAPSALDATWLSTYNARDVLERDRLGRVVNAGGFSVGGTSGSPTYTANVNEQFVPDSLGRMFEERFQYPAGGTNIVTVWSGFNAGDLFREEMKYLDGTSTLHLDFAADPIGRISQVDWDRGAGMEVLAEYSYLGNQRRYRKVRYTNPDTFGETTYSYDGYGRLGSILDQVTQNGGLPSTISSFTYEYDAASNLKKERYTKQDGSAGDRFTYDDYHRLARAWLGVDQATMTLSDQDLLNPPQGTTPVYVKRLTYNLDDANNRTTVETENGYGGNETTDTYTLETGSNRYATAPGGTLTYDLRGNLIWDGQRQYVYDYMNRLTEVWVVVEDSALSSTTSTLSAMQSSSTQEYVVVDWQTMESARDLILRGTGYNYEEILQRHQSSTYRDRLHYDVTGAVVPVLQGGGGGMSAFADQELALLALYAYDPFNRRTVRAVMGEDNYFSSWDGWREVMESTTENSAVTAQKSFVWGNELDELLSYRDREAGAWTDYFIAQDGAHGPVRLLDSAGNEKEVQEYDPYGKTSFFQGGAFQGHVSGFGNPFQWKGLRVDPETGLIYMRNRYYSTRWGRFLSQDPFGVWADIGNRGNAYNYAGSRPLTLDDPFGRQTRIGVRISGFIGSSHGEWITEPFPFTDYEAQGDNREAGEPGSSRVSVTVTTTFDGSAMDPDSATATVETGTSHRRERGTTEPVWSDQTEPRGTGPHGFSGNGGRQVVSGSAAGNYPFVPGSPDIDIRYFLIWGFGTIAFEDPCNGIRYTTFPYAFRIMTDGFPDYEVFINGVLRYSWISPDAGPGLGNLGGGPEILHFMEGTAGGFEPIIAPSDGIRIS